MYNVPKLQLGNYAHIKCSARCVIKIIWGLIQQIVPQKFEKILNYHEDKHVSRWTEMDGWTDRLIDWDKYDFCSSHSVVLLYRVLKMSIYFDIMAYIIKPMQL